jgi:hypothetical protein
VRFAAKPMAGTLPKGRARLAFMLGRIPFAHFLFAERKFSGMQADGIFLLGI